MYGIMLGCFCKAILREEGATHLQNGDTMYLEIRRLSSTSIRKECLPRKFMKTSWKPLGRSLLLNYSTVKKWAAEFKRGRERALRMMDSLATPKMPPLMKMSRPCTPWLCVIGGKTCEA